MRRWISGLCGLVLGLGQFGLLAFWLLHPQGSAMYRQFYVTRARACWLPDDVAAQSRAALAGQRMILPASLAGPDACYMLMRGWAGRDGVAAWNLGADAMLDLPILPGARQVVLSLGALVPHPPLKLRLRVDGRAAGDAYVPAMPGLASVVVNVPQGGAGDLIVEIAPSNGGNVLGLGLTRVTWTN